MSLDWIDGPVSKRSQPQPRMCTACQGTGLLGSDGCPDCVGTGKVKPVESWTGAVDVERALGDDHLRAPKLRKFKGERR